MKRTLPVFAGAALTMMLFSSCSGGPPSSIGLHHGKLSPCPDSQQDLAAGQVKVRLKVRVELHGTAGCPVGSYLPTT